MTDFLIDLASYQQGIDLAKVKAAGFTRVNVKLSQGNWYQWSQAGFYINRARELGVGVCTFHWLDNSASGGEQARIVLGLMRRYGVLDGTAHQNDCEDSSRPATWTIWRDYMTAMQDGLQRHVINYTGDWWWPQHMGDRGAEVTPYLWAAPNNGYLGAYAGDTSGHWRAGYGGWGDYSMLQYAVQPIPGAGGGDLSKTAIRDPAVWAALTGGHDMPLTQADITAIKVAVNGGADALTIDQLQRWLGDGVDGRGGSASPIAPRPSLALVLKTLETLSAQAGGAPTQAQVDAAMLKALQDPSVVNAIGAAVASHIHVS